MQELQYGIGLYGERFALMMALSMNVFSFGVEWYDESFWLRVGPFTFGVGWQ